MQKKLIDEHWEPLSREMGLKSHSNYYGKDHPLIAIRDNVQNFVASGVYKLLDEQPEKAAAIIEGFLDNEGNFTVDPDKMLHKAVETTMQVMEYEEIAKVVKGTPAYEDFNHDKYNNHRAEDFDRKWNHTRAKMKTVLMGDLEDEENDEPFEVADNSVDVANEVFTNIKQDGFWAAISENDKKLLRLRMKGKNQTEIAEELGYKTHSAVTKRLQKLKEIFEDCA